MATLQSIIDRKRAAMELYRLTNQYRKSISETINGDYRHKVGETYTMPGMDQMKNVWVDIEANITNIEKVLKTKIGEYELAIHKLAQKEAT